MPPVSCKVGSVLIGFLSSRGGPTSTHRKATITGLSELETNYQPGFFDLFILRQCYIVLSFSSQTVTWTWKHPFFFFPFFQVFGLPFLSNFKNFFPRWPFQTIPKHCAPLSFPLSLSPSPSLPLISIVFIRNTISSPCRHLLSLVGVLHIEPRALCMLTSALPLG